MLKTVFFYGRLLIPILFASKALAISSTIGDITNALTLQAPPWEQLVTAAAYIMGVAFIISGIIKFRNHREAPQQVPLSAPIVLMTIGAFLVYLPTTIDILRDTFFGSSDTYTGNWYWGKQQLMDGSTLNNVVRY